jgi:uncharacterized membrane-anchored protein
MGENGPMWIRVRLLCVVLLSLFAAAPGVAQQQQNDVNADVWSEIRKLDWQFGPTEGHIAGTATIAVPKDSVFLGSVGTRRFLELQGNLGNDNDFTFAPGDLSWFSVFSYDPSGHVADNENIDPDTLLELLKKTNLAGNEERKRLGLETLVLDDWYVSPHYDILTKRLEWATKLRDPAGGISVNYAIRLLGRTGVMSAILVSNPTTLERDIKSFKVALAGFEFDSGQKYAEFRAGDKVAEYGLAALIVGGAAAAAAKSGAFNIIGKFIGVGAMGGLAAAWAAVRGFFARRRRQA